MKFEDYYDVVEERYKVDGAGYKRKQYRVRCSRCGNTRWIYKSSISSIKSRGNSFTGMCRSCYDKAKVGKNNPNWKGGRRINKQGYVQIRVGGKLLLEHRAVMEKHLGRKLESWEIVHHKDGNKENNKLNNLELHKPKDHDTITLLMRENRKLKKELKKYHEQFAKVSTISF